MGDEKGQNGTNDPVLYLRVHRLRNVVVCIVGVFPGENDDFTGTISKQLQVLWSTRNCMQMDGQTDR